MAQPRVFISSTCYDLQEIRFQLRQFVEDFGFIPVMSEFGDIFYDYKKHVQDSCKEEISKSQLFVLIIGNNFGSIYYKHKDIVQSPDSVTMQEFKKAIEIDIFKHIFINKFVDYDYNNYIKLLNKYLQKELDKNDIDENNIDERIQTLKKEFKASYPFPQDSYKFIFNFLDIIYQLDSNNAISTYESFEQIKNSLRKQWAGFIYDSIVKSKTIDTSEINELNNKLDSIENQIKLLVEGQIIKENEKSKITFDISKLAENVNLKEFTKVKDEIHNLIYELLMDTSNTYSHHQRIRLLETVDDNQILQWMKSLGLIVKKYKWAKSIDANIVFNKIGVNFNYFKYFKEIPYDTLLKFYTLSKNAEESLNNEDYNGLITVLTEKFNSYYKPESSSSEEDIPF